MAASSLPSDFRRSVRAPALPRYFALLFSSAAGSAVARAMLAGEQLALRAEVETWLAEQREAGPRLPG